MFNLIMFAFFLYPWYVRIVLRIFIVILSGHWSRPGERSIEIFEQFFLDFLRESGRCWSKCLPGVILMIHFHSDLKSAIIGSRFCNPIFPHRHFISSNFISFVTLIKPLKVLKRTALQYIIIVFHFELLKCSQCRCLKRNWNIHKWRCTPAS